MLEAVANQLLDKALSYSPNRKLSGAEVVTLIKHLARSGWAMGLNVDLKGGTAAGTENPFCGTLVLRGASNKEMRPLSSRILGLIMGSEPKPRIERKEGRPLVVVPYGAAGAPQDSGWVWWPEKDDLVIAASYPSAAESVLAALDGKIPSAADHTIVRELSKPESGFDPVCLAFVDVANCPKTPAKVTEFINQLNLSGIQRIDYRWGFDDEALMTVTRVVAPRPRKPLLALFDQPGFDKSSLLPVPDGVQSFLELSINPGQLLETVGGLDPSGEAKAKIEEFGETIQNAGKIDLRKDMLEQLGPRMALYIAPGRSAATGDGSFETSWLQGFTPSLALSALSHLPKITLVAEINDPVKFGRALEGAIIALNNELKVQAIEKAKEEQAAQPGQGAAGGANPGPGGRQGPVGQRPSRRRSLEGAAAPRFEPIPGQSGAYMLRTPSDSPLRLGPPGFRPVIRIEEKYVAISIAADGVEAALKAVKRKDWKASDDVQQASSHLPPKLILLGVGDPREVLPPLLSSLPGTLQTIINSAITMDRARGGAGTNPPGRGMNQPGAPPGFGAGGQSGRFGAGGSGGPGGPGGRLGGRRGGEGPGGAGGPGGFPGAPTPGGNNNAGSASEGMIELKVDSDKLPKAEDIRSRLFLTTYSVAVSDQDIRLIRREAFPSLTDMGIGVALVLPAVQAARARAQEVQGGISGQTPAPAAPPAAPGQFGGAGAPRTGPGASGAPGGGRPGGPGRPGARGRRDDQ
jgi:hypothetical protein